MRFTVLAGALALMGTGACVARDRPYRFSSPMLGMAEVPPPPLPGAPTTVKHDLSNREPASRKAQAIRVISAPPVREASAALAAQIAEAPAAQPEARAELPSPHRIAATVPLPAAHELPHLRDLVGRRDKHDPIDAAIAWSHELGLAIEGETSGEVIAWAERTNRLVDPLEAPRPGDLLVFDHVSTDAEADLIAIVIDRDDRGVTAYIYLGGGVVRRGFVDPARRAKRRDEHDRVVNTYLRHGKRWPTKGTHYLAGELLAHVIHTR